MRLVDGEDNCRSSPKTKSKEPFNKLSNALLSSESKQSGLLKQKIDSLTGSITTLKQQNNNLRDERERLLQINSMYLNNIEKIYESRTDLIKNSSTRIIGDDYVTEEKLKNYLKRIDAKAMKAAEIDYRGLVKHCLLLNKEVKYIEYQCRTYRKLASQLGGMRNILSQTEHANLQQVIAELKKVIDENRNLRTSLNKVEFQCQKMKQEKDQAKEHITYLQQNCEGQKKEIVELKNTINRMLSENKEMLNQRQKQVYSLSVKCDGLEHQLRKGQLRTSKYQQLTRKHQIQSIESTHREIQLRKSLSEMINTPHPRTNFSQPHQEELSRTRQIYYTSRTPISHNPRRKKSNCRIIIRKQLSLQR